MKKVIVIAGIFTLILSACSSLKKSTYNDDVYVDPKEEKLEKERLALEKKKKEEEEAKKQAEELAAQKEKDDNNPAYKDPVYDKDDYYDYQYASRLRRFNNPVYGLGYYDNYYTNYYWYNNNPSYYGTSIYSSYSWWGPSYYGGCNYGWGSPYYGYNPYGYNPYGYGYGPYGYGYNPWSYNNGYWNGYYNGYNHGFYNGYYGSPYGGGGWGYFNGLDVNSGYSKATYAPRTSHGGNNSARVSNPGNNPQMDGYLTNYMNGVATQQENFPKFDAKVAVPVKPSKSLDHGNTIISPSGNDVIPNEPRKNPYNSNPKSGVNHNQSNDVQINNPPPVKTNPPVKTDPGKNIYEGPPKQPIKTETPKRNNFESENQTQFNKSSSSPPSGGSGSSPRSGGKSSGGNSRPR